MPAGLKVLNRITNLSRESLDYVTIYQITYNRLIKEAKKRKNVRFVLRARNKTKAMWQIINRILYIMIIKFI
jgi:hypothetical protein